MQLKRKNVSIISIIIASLVLSLGSCSDDNFSSDPNLRLEFGGDKISFDTVFSSIGSATQAFKIHNRNSKSLTISSVRIKHANTSGFLMNIDGEKGSELYNIDVLKKDSIFAFVKVKVNPHSGNPTIIRDTIEFTTNGHVQEIYLEAIGQDVYIWKGKIISSDTTLTKDKPFLIYDSLVVKAGVKLSMQEGTNLFFRSKAKFNIQGSIDARGTVAEPIIWRGDRRDYIEKDTPYDNVPGQWNGVFVYSNSYNNHLENVYIRNNQYGLTFLPSTTSQKKANLINTIVHNTSESGLTVQNCDIDAVNCLFSNSRGSVLTVQGGKYNFLHCTFANYYRWASRQKYAVVISNILDLTQAVDLDYCNFTNSIVYGSVKDEIRIEKIKSNILNYNFTYCLLKTDPSIGGSNNIWNKDPMFNNLDNEKHYFYSFKLSDGSAAINNANLASALSAPLDLNGKSRTSDGKPDMGCYEKTN